MTKRQKALAKEIVGNSSATLKEAMLKVGYTEATASHPSQITEGDGFQELLAKYLPDDDVLKAHKDGLEATKQLSVRGGNANAESDDFIEVPDYPTRLKAVELAYKAKGKLKDGVNVQGDLNMSVTIVRHAVT